MIEIEESDDVYLVHPSIASSLMGEPMLGAYQLFTAITRPGTVFIWPIKLPKGDGVWNSWPQSAAQIAQLATDAGYESSPIETLVRTKRSWRTALFPTRMAG